jgi:prepilin-type N-terminal cleavage/methylation domain-containing protein
LEIIFAWLWRPEQGRGTMKKGFTLVEMVVAISIFGLIVAVGTPSVVRFLHHFQSRDSAQYVSGLLRQARNKAIHEKNNYVVFFSTTRRTVTLLDDDGGGNGNPSDPGYVATNRGNSRTDQGERVYGPYPLPRGQVFGLVGGTVGPDGTYVTTPVTFSGSPPRVIFNPNGSTNEEGLIFVMPEGEFRAQKRGAEQMLVVRRSTGSVLLARPTYN